MFRLICIAVLVFSGSWVVFADQKNDKEAVLSELSAYADKNPTVLAGAIFTMCDYYLRENNPQKAIALYEKSASILGDNEDYLSRLGNLYNQTAQYDKALKVFEKLTALRPENSGYFQMMTSSLSALGKKTEADAIWKKLIAQRPNDANTISQAANFYSNAGDFENAVSLTEKAITLEQNNIGLKQNLANLLAQQGKFDKAEAAYNSIIDSTNEPWLKDWAGSELLNVYQKQNRLDDLAKKLEEGLKAKPDDPYLNKRLGELYARKGNNAKALELYEEAAKLTSDRGLKNRLLDMYEANNKLQEAEGLLEKLIKENPSELYLTERLAMLYERQGKKDAAVKTWEAIAAKGTKDSNFYQRYADSLMRMSNPEGALSQLKKAQGLEPGNMSFVLRSGVILMNAGKSKEAKAAFEKVLADTGARDAWVKDEAKRLLGQLEAMAVTNAKPVIQEIAKPVAQREPVKKEVTVQPSEVLRRVQVNASTEHSDETLPRAELLQKEEPAEKIQVEEVKPAVEAETTKAAAKAEAKP